MKDDRKVIAFRVKPDFHKAVRQISLDNDTTVQEYVKSLVVADALAKRPDLKEIIEKA